MTTPALLQLIWLASPALPVGGFSYSEGLEAAVDAGRVEARLHVSTDTPDADWAVKLVDVHPDGKAYNLAMGILRGRFARSLEKPEPLMPGGVVEIAVDLGP